MTSKKINDFDVANHDQCEDQRKSNLSCLLRQIITKIISLDFNFFKLY